MTKNRIVKYAANTALLAVLAAAGIGVYQIGTYTPDKEIQEELQTDQSEDTEETPVWLTRRSAIRQGRTIQQKKKSLRRSLTVQTVQKKLQTVFLQMK